MDEKKSIADMTDFQVEDSYVEDGVLNVLVSPQVSPEEKPGDPEPRWTLLADPKTRELRRIDFCVATDEGFEYPAYSPTEEQMALPVLAADAQGLTCGDLFCGCVPDDSLTAQVRRAARQLGVTLAHHAQIAGLLDGAAE